MDFLIEICNYLIQLCGLLLMTFDHLLDLKVLTVHQLA